MQSPLQSSISKMRAQRSTAKDTTQAILVAVVVLCMAFLLLLARAPPVCGVNPPIGQFYGFYRSSGASVSRLKAVPAGRYSGRGKEARTADSLLAILTAAPLARS
jgi:hypothetical protein